MLSAKSLNLVLIEASVVGVSLIVLVYILKQFMNYIPDFSGSKQEVEFLFVVGFLFHFLFEYTGVNLWYSKEYCKLI